MEISGLKFSLYSENNKWWWWWWQEDDAVVYILNYLSICLLSSILWPSINIFSSMKSNEHSQIKDSCCVRFANCYGCHTTHVPTVWLLWQSKSSQTLTSLLFLCDNFLRLSDNSKAFLFILGMSSYTMLYLTERVRRYSMKSIWRMKGAFPFSAMCSDCKSQRIQTFMWIFAQFKGNKLTTCF